MNVVNIHENIENLEQIEGAEGIIRAVNPYLRGKIYRIVDRTTDKTYIGSTTKNTVNIRFSYHKSDYKRYLAGRYGFCSSFDIIANGNCYAELVALYPCGSKRELKAEEKRYINIERNNRDVYCVNLHL